MPDQRQSVTPQEYERIRAMIGTDAETFKRTKLGQYILDHCNRMSDEFTKELKKIDPKDQDGIRLLQNEIWKHEQFEIFLNDAINSGLAAMQNLQQMEAHEEDQRNYYPEDDQ